MSKNLHILGLFPDILNSYLNSALLGRAVQNGILAFHFHQIRDWAEGKYKAVDDRAYGGGPGMVFLPELVTQAVRDLKSKHKIAKVIMPSPRGKLLTPDLAKRLSEDDDLLFLCGRYEGIDDRAVDLVVDEEISIGDYVVTGGELAAGVIIDALSRYVPGVVGKGESVEKDSFQEGLLEHPHYTRPEVFEGQPVPEVLLSGNHAKIAEWRRRESLRVTWARRPDLLKKANLSPEELDYIKQLIHRG